MEQIFESRKAGRKVSDMNIVIVPAIGLSRPSQWLDPSGQSWLQKLLDDIMYSADIWEHIPDPDQKGSLVQRLLWEGSKFLDSLYLHFVQNEAKKIPLVFICHGTGAFVLKRTLCICREQSFQYRPLIELLSGAIFLGAPHFGGDIKQAKRVLDLLLKCQYKGNGRSLASEADVKELVGVCKSFELLSLSVPVLSAFESKETPTYHGMFSKFRSKAHNQVIITQALGTLRASTEVVIDSETNHFEICNIPVGGKIYQASVKLIVDVMEEAPKRIAQASRAYSPPAGLRDHTLQSPSTAGETRLEETSSRKTSIPISYPLGGATGGSTIGSFEVVPAEAALEISRTDPILPCFSLGAHQRANFFVGREDVMKKIDDHLLPASTNPDVKPLLASEEQLRSFAICGLGGMGKTELAVEYAYSRRESFEAIFWLAAEDAKILASDFAQLAIRLGFEDSPSDFAASRDVVMGWLAQPLRKMSSPDTPDNLVSWLLIFDNVDNLDTLSDYWPKFGRGSVLITSRDPYARHHLFTEKGMDLPPLSNSESELLMQRLTYVRADVDQQNALADIAVKLGGLPLAINQMSGIFRRLRLSYTEFYKFYNEEGILRLFDRQTGANESQQFRSLATVWALDQLSANTKALLQVICLLDPDGIPEGLLIDKLGEVKLQDYPQTMGEYYDARLELLSSSLITRNANEDKLSLHRLIQDTAKAMMGKQELIAAFEAANSLVISAWPFQSMKEHHSIARFTECEAIFPSVLRLKLGLTELIQTASDFQPDIRVARLLNDTGWYMFERGLPEETSSFCDLALLIAERLKDTLGETAIESIRESHSFIGIALVETNEHSRSMSHKAKWLDMLLERKTESGGHIEDYELGYAYNEIGVAYGNTNMLDKAIISFRRSIEIFQGLDDYEDIMLGWPEPNLGFIYWMQGNLEDAENALVEILDIHAEKWGVDDTKSFKTGKILYGMGNVLESKGRLEESFNFHLRCFEQYKKVLGMNHHRFGDICYKMAAHWMRQGRNKDSERFLNTSIKIFSSRSYLANELARATFKKGKLFAIMGMHGEAEGLFSDAYTIWRRLQPSDVRPLEVLDEEDFDTLVAFWSR